MSLMKKAIDRAETNQQVRFEKQLAAQKKEGDKLADAFTEFFGIAARYHGHSNDVTYHKHAQTYGGWSWMKKTTERIRLAVDDVVLGWEVKADRAIENHIERPGVIYLACAKCGTTYPHYIAGVYGADKMNQTQRLTALLDNIGRVATSGDICTSCQAQPCPTCGRAQ